MENPDKNKFSWPNTEDLSIEDPAQLFKFAKQLQGMMKMYSKSPESDTAATKVLYNNLSKLVFFITQGEGGVVLSPEDFLKLKEAYAAFLKGAGFAKNAEPNRGEAGKEDTTSTGPSEKNGDRFERKETESKGAKLERLKSQYLRFNDWKDQFSVRASGSSTYSNFFGPLLNYRKIFTYLAHNSEAGWRGLIHQVVDRQLVVEKMVDALSKKIDIQKKTLGVEKEELDSFVTVCKQLDKLMIRFDKSPRGQIEEAKSIFNRLERVAASFTPPPESEPAPQADDGKEDVGSAPEEDTAGAREEEATDQSGQASESAEDDAASGGEGKTEEDKKGDSSKKAEERSDEKAAEAGSSEKVNPKERTQWSERSKEFKEQFTQREVVQLIEQIDRLQAMVNRYRESHGGLSHADASKKVEGYVAAKLQLGKLKKELERYTDKDLNEEDYEHFYQKRSNIAQYILRLRRSLRSEEPKPEPGPGPTPEPDPVPPGPEPEPVDPIDPGPTPEPEPGPVPPEPEPGPTPPPGPEPEPKPEGPKTPYEEARTKWKETHEALKVASEAHFSDVNKTHQKHLAEELAKTGGLVGRLFNRSRRKELKLAQDSEFNKYEDAKIAYAKAFQNVTEARKANEGSKSADGTSAKGFDNYQSTLGARFFATSEDASYREARSFKSKENAFNRELLPEPKQRLLGKVFSSYQKLPYKTKMMVGGAIAGAFGVASGGVTAAGAGLVRYALGATVGSFVSRGVSSGVLALTEGRLVRQRALIKNTRGDAITAFNPDQFREQAAGIKKTETDLETKARNNKRLATTAGLGAAFATGRGIGEFSSDLFGLGGGVPTGVATPTTPTMPSGIEVPITTPDGSIAGMAPEVGVVTPDGGIDPRGGVTEFRTLRPSMESVLPDASPEGGASIERPSLGMYTVERNDNFWDISEGQTSAAQPAVFSEVPKADLQATIDLTRDYLNAHPDIASDIGFRVDGDIGKIYTGQTLDLDKLDAVARNIAIEKGFISPDIIIDTPKIVTVEPVATETVVTPVETVDATVAPEVTIETPTVFDLPTHEWVVGADARGVSYELKDLYPDIFGDYSAREWNSFITEVNNNPNLLTAAHIGSGNINIVLPGDHIRMDVLAEYAADPESKTYLTETALAPETSVRPQARPEDMSTSDLAPEESIRPQARPETIDAVDPAILDAQVESMDIPNNNGEVLMTPENVNQIPDNVLAETFGRESFIASSYEDILGEDIQMPESLQDQQLIELAQWAKENHVVDLTQVEKQFDIMVQRDLLPLLKLLEIDPTLDPSEALEAITTAGPGGISWYEGVMNAPYRDAGTIPYGSNPASFAFSQFVDDCAGKVRGAESMTVGKILESAIAGGFIQVVDGELINTL